MASFDQQKTSREEIQMLTFSLDNVSYGVNVHQVREVKNFEGVTPVPYAPAYVKGVTNLRGEVIPVIDLRKRFGMSARKGNDDNGIMVIVQDKHPIGVMVDSVMEVLTLPKKDIESNPDSLITDKSQAILGVAKHDKDLIILLDLMKVVSRGDLENMKDVAKGFQVQAQMETPKTVPA
jgi:purine-binding chemotaxis protein CheW